MSKEHLISSAALPEVCGQERGQKGLKRGGFAPCYEDKIGEGLRTVSPSVLVASGGMMKQVGAMVLTLEGAGGRVSGSSSFSAAGFPHFHTSCDAMRLVTAFPKSVAA